MKKLHIRWDDAQGLVQLVSPEGEVIFTMTKGEWSLLIANPVRGKAK